MRPTDRVILRSWVLEWLLLGQEALGISGFLDLFRSEEGMSGEWVSHMNLVPREKVGLETVCWQGVMGM